MTETWLPVKKAPCNECPFRKVAPPGWLGGGEDGLASKYLAVAHSDTNLACHKSPGYAADKASEMRPCAGLALYRRNVCKSPRDPWAARAKKMVGDEHRTEVFATPAEFMARHDTELNRSMMSDMHRERTKSL